MPTFFPVVDVKKFGPTRAAGNSSSCPGGFQRALFHAFSSDCQPTPRSASPSLALPLDPFFSLTRASSLQVLLFHRFLPNLDLNNLGRNLRRVKAACQASCQDRRRRGGGGGGGRGGASSRVILACPARGRPRPLPLPFFRCSHPSPSQRDRQQRRDVNECLGLWAKKNQQPRHILSSGTPKKNTQKIIKSVYHSAACALVCYCCRPQNRVQGRLFCFPLSPSRAKRFPAKTSKREMRTRCQLRTEPGPAWPARLG